MQADGTLQPHTFVWQGKPLQVVSVGRQWIEGEQRHMLVMTANHETFELIGAVHWVAQKISDGAEIA
jgi:hypothetical protein